MLEPAPAIDLSILVVTYGNPGLTERCLRSVFTETRGIAFEVVAVDNKPGDGNAELIANRFPQVRLLEPGSNLGFAGANNLAASAARGDHLVLLNPDTVVLDGALVNLLAFARSQPRPVIAGGRTLRPDGSTDPSSCWGLPSLWSLACFALGLSTLRPRSSLLAPESLGPWQRDTVREVGMVTGCLLLLRRSDWEDLGGFDTGFFMYGEDADLAIRARRAGLRSLITPAATITHVVGASSDPGGKRVLVLGARVALMRKHWSPRAFTLGVILLELGVLLRAGLGRVARRLRRSGGGSGGSWQQAWERRSEWRSARADG